MKILTVIGARPQFIKAAVVSRVFRGMADVREIIIHTGQHYDANMSDVFFTELDIPKPDYNLGIGGSLHGAMTGRQLEAVEKVLLDEKPDRVLVYGDTNSTLAGALAAVKLHIPVAHVEAGLRSFNRKMPEEINRILTDHAADLLFAPTDTAVENLRREGFTNIINENPPLPSCITASPLVINVGDVMYDAALFYGKIADNKRHLLQELGIERKNYILATVHRAENTDDPSRAAAIVRGLIELSREIPVVLPLHPRTRKALAEHDLLAWLTENIQVIDPVGYLEMVLLEKNAALVATDSGGVQKEAYFHQVPCITLRDETEWVELVETGWNRVVPPVDGETIAEKGRQALGSRGSDQQLYGDGHAARKIVEALVGGGCG